MFAIISELNGASGFERTDDASAKLGKLKTMLHRAGIRRCQEFSLISDLLSLPTESSQSIAQLSPSSARKKRLRRCWGRIKVWPHPTRVDDR